MRRLLLPAIAILLAISTIVPVSAAVVVDGDDDAVTGRRWVRHDGGDDAAIRHCNDDSTSPEPDDPRRRPRLERRRQPAPG